MTDTADVSYCWCDVVASLVERPWEGSALDRNYRIGTVCCDGSERVAADANKHLQREQTVLVSWFLSVPCLV